MRTRKTRVYIDLPLKPDTELELPASAAHHILRVLRMQKDDIITLFNGHSETQFNAVITAVKRNKAFVRIKNLEITNTESRLHTTLVQAISSSDKMDFSIQKAVELGVSEIIPVYSSRSAPVFKADRLTKRLQHWRQVIISATEQCGRTVLPTLDEPRHFTNLVEQQTSQTTGFILDPRSSFPLSEQKLDGSAVQIWVGPEGGFSTEEIDQVQKSGVLPVTFGPRILRTETAGIAALTLLQARFGDI